MLFTWAGILRGNLVQLASLFNCISFLFSRKLNTFNFVMLLVIHENWSYGSYLNFLPSFCPSVFVCLFAYYFYIILLTFFQTIFLTCFIFELGRITWISNNTTVFLGEGKNSSLPLFKFGIFGNLDSMHPRRPRGNTSGRQLGRQKRRGESFQARSGTRAPGDTARAWKLSSRRFARLD